MTDTKGVMDEIFSSMQLFGEHNNNWYQLRDYLCYLDDQFEPSPTALVVLSPESLLADQPDQIRWFVQTFEEVGEWWTRPIQDGSKFDRPAMPFHLVLRASREAADALARRFPSVPQMNEELVPKKQQE